MGPVASAVVATVAADFDQAMTAEPDVQFACPASDPPMGDAAEPESHEQGSPQIPKSGGYAGLLAVSAMASGLLMGFLLAASFGVGSDIRAGNGLLFAQGALADSLSNEMSGSHGIGPSFWSRDGYFCRAFDTTNGTHPGLDGIACREGTGWQISVVTTSAGQGSMPTARVRGVMEDMIVGTPLDATAERQARRQGWRPE
ncbi:MAG TPA: hypothetical protein VFW28_18530 [Micropepsaceae bacterium]|nr:hypothetical protein [Micropepsaceae bacterium]